MKRSYPHIEKSEQADIVEASLEMVGLKDSMHKYPANFPGMQQRVGIARAIAVKPRMLLWMSR